MNAWLLVAPTKCQERDGRGINVRSVWHAERHSVAGIPPSTWAHSINQHPDAHVDSFDRASALPETTVPNLPECDETVSGGNNPARRAWNPTPSVLARI